MIGASVVILAALGPVSCMNNNKDGETLVQSSDRPETAAKQGSFMHFYKKLHPGIVGFDMEGTYSGSTVPEVNVQLCNFTVQNLVSGAFNPEDCEAVTGAEASILVWGNEGQVHGPVYVQADKEITNAMLVVTPSDGSLSPQKP